MLGVGAKRRKAKVAEVVAEVHVVRVEEEVAQVEVAKIAVGEGWASGKLEAGELGR